MYKLIYSIKGDSCGGIFALLGLVPAVIGVVILFARPHWSALRARGIWYPAAMIVGGCAWSLAGLLFFLNCADLRAALSAGRTEVLEGIVQQYAETTKEAAFTVAGRSFSVSPYRIGPGYKRLRRDGSPLQDGVRVRLHCRGQQILMIELAE